MKYTGKTIIGIAQERGSSAKTRAGAWKYLLSHLPGLTFSRSYVNHSEDWSLVREVLALSKPGYGMAEGDPRLIPAREAYHSIMQRRRSERRAARIAVEFGYPLHSEQWAWYCEAYDMHREYLHRCSSTLHRTGYGDIRHYFGSVSGTYNAPYWLALDMVKQAAATDLLDASYDSIGFDRKGRAKGDAVHHELYDFAPGAALVCVRRTEGTRYGVKTLSKTYYMIEQVEETVLCTLTTKPVAKWAKQSAEFGQVIAAIRGQIKIPAPQAAPVPGYKLLRVNENGTLASVWDGSPWDFGKRRTEAVRDNHEGGLYYYRDLRKCLEAAHLNTVFAPDMEHHRLAVLRIEASGRHIPYAAGKFAATHITPLEIIAMTI